MDRWVGSSETTIRSLFVRAREHKSRHGYPAVIFIDEADAILGRRGSGISSDMERTIVPMFLAEMDGLDDSGSFMILATNRPDILDPAVVRDGRIDRKIKVTRPHRKASEEIFRLHLGSKPIQMDCGINDMADYASNTLFSSKHVLYKVDMRVENDIVHDVKCFTLGHMSSGAMIAGIVDRATSLAMHRDIASGSASGITSMDIDLAITQVFHESRDLDCSDALSDFIGDKKDAVVGIHPFCTLH